MKNFDCTRSSRSGITHVPGDAFAPAPSSFGDACVADDGFDVDSWLGYESIHPLTWVPTHGAADGLRAE